MSVRRDILFVALICFISIPAFCSSISHQDDPPIWSLRTASSVYQTAVASDGALIPVYYGSAGEFLSDDKEYRPVRLRGLDAGAEYIVSRDSKTQIAMGESLMNVGIPWNLWENTSGALVRLQRK